MVNEIQPWFNSKVHLFLKFLQPSEHSWVSPMNIEEEAQSVQQSKKTAAPKHQRYRWMTKRYNLMWQNRGSCRQNIWKNYELQQMQCLETVRKNKNHWGLKSFLYKPNPHPNCLCSLLKQQIFCLHSGFSTHQ